MASVTGIFSAPNNHDYNAKNNSSTRISSTAYNDDQNYDTTNHNHDGNAGSV